MVQGIALCSPGSMTQTKHTLLGPWFPCPQGGRLETCSDPLSVPTYCDSEWILITVNANFTLQGQCLGAVTKDQKKPCRNLIMTTKSNPTYTDGLALVLISHLLRWAQA